MKKIYELKVKNKEGNKVVTIPMKNFDGDVSEKSNLSLIDKGTMRFKNNNELIKYLFDNKFIDFFEGEAYISYKSVNKGDKKATLKSLGVVYNDCLEELNKYQTQGNYVDVSSKEFKILFNHFIGYTFNEIKFLNLIKDKVITERLYELIHRYYNNQPVLPKLEKEFSRYKVIRGYVMYTKGYDLSEQLIVESEPIETDNSIDYQKLASLTENGTIQTLIKSEDMDELYSYLDLDSAIDEFGENFPADGSRRKR